MSSTDNPEQSTDQGPPPTPTWTYPTRFCRICREDVSPTVSMYPPGLPIAFQRPIVEYKNEDEYGRLIKPCLCRGGMRYIHELCLLRSRTENQRAGSMWKCHECGHRFNFNRLAIQRFLSSRWSSGSLTVCVMLSVMFFLGFVGDPIINLYVDPYYTLTGKEDLWNEVKVQTAKSGIVSQWGQHFLKGFISMGLVGFMKVLIGNPFHWWNLRNGGMLSSSSRMNTSTSGRDRAVNISWIAVIIGISSAFYFFYWWVQNIIQKFLQRLGNNIVDTQLSGDDDDLKAPSERTFSQESNADSTATKVTQDKPEPGPAPTVEAKPNTEPTSFQTSTPASTPEKTQSESEKVLSADESTKSDSDNEWEQISDMQASHVMTEDTQPAEKPAKNNLTDSPTLVGSWPDGSTSLDLGRSSALETAQSQGWSFKSL